MLKERNNQEKQNGINLKKIHDLNYAVTKLDSLLEGIICFKGDMQNQYNYLSEFYNSIKDEIISPLQTLHEKISGRISFLSYEMKTTERNYNSVLSKVEESKNKFHTSAFDAEIFKLKIESDKEKKKINHDDIIEEEKKLQAYLKSAKENEQNYIKTVSQANYFQELYIETKKRIMTEFQDLEEQLGENIKDALRKYVIYQTAYIRNMQYDIERKAKIMEEIDIKKDIRQLIYRNNTNDLPPYKIEVIPFNSDLTNNRNILNQFSKKTVENVTSFFSNIFYRESAIENQDYENKVLSEIETMINNIISGKVIPVECLGLLTNYTKNHYNIKLILQTLNKIRQKGKFLLNEESYKNIGNILKECLNFIQLQKNNYYSNAKLLMNLAGSLYKQANEPNKPRIFLQEYLQDHIIWNLKNYWKNMIKYFINEEMHNQKNYNIYSTESFEDKEKRIQVLVQSQINSFLYNMFSFNVNPKIIKECIQEFIEYYNLDNTFSDKIQENIQNYQIKFDEKKNQNQGNKTNTNSNNHVDNTINNTSVSSNNTSSINNNK